MPNYWQALGLPLPNADAASLIIPWKEQATDSLLELEVSSGKEPARAPSTANSSTPIRPDLPF